MCLGGMCTSSMDTVEGLSMCVHVHREITYNCIRRSVAYKIHSKIRTQQISTPTRTYVRI